MIEKEMGYRGSKSITDLNVPQAINKFVIVKEQRVDGSYTNNLVLRCTLMGLERDYRVKVLSNQMKFYRPYSTYSSCFPQPKIKLRSKSFSAPSSQEDYSAPSVAPSVTKREEVF